MPFLCEVIMNVEEQQYLNLLKNILENGSNKEDRTGIGTKSIFGSTLRFNLLDNTLPALTTKKVFIRGAIEELLFFIRGDTDTKKLEAKGINIWKGNTSREFLDKKGLKYLPEGSLGKGYGFQWRKFGEVKSDPAKVPMRWTFNDVEGVDQLSNVIDQIKKDPNSRRHIVSAWNPQQLKQMSLEPCHMMYQFYVDNGTLSCQWYQRSVDSFLGLPFNIISYSVLTHLIAKIAGLTAKEVIFVGGDTHIYNNHIEQVKEQLTREPYDFPKININKEIKTLEDVENLSFENFQIENYKFHPAIKGEMAV
jgi:thymidylate synthase